MIYLVATVLVVLVLLLVGAVLVVLSLLKRVNEANQQMLGQAQAMVTQAVKMQSQAPKQMDQMLASLADSTARIHATIESTVKTVLSPPPMLVDTGVNAMSFAMPTMDEGKETAGWDHTDMILADPPTNRPSVDMGYEHEADPDFDPDNPFGIPGLKSMVP
jgi:Tfp pilus assembly protein FimV